VVRERERELVKRVLCSSRGGGRLLSPRGRSYRPSPRRVQLHHPLPIPIGPNEPFTPTAAEQLGGERVAAATSSPPRRFAPCTLLIESNGPEIITRAGGSPCALGKGLAARSWHPDKQWQRSTAPSNDPNSRLGGGRWRRERWSRRRTTTHDACHNQ
jgi:hypothetical protein